MWAYTAFCRENRCRLLIAKSSGVRALIPALAAVVHAATVDAVVPLRRPSLPVPMSESGSRSAPHRERTDEDWSSTHHSFQMRIVSAHRPNIGRWIPPSRSRPVFGSSPRRVWADPYKRHMCHANSLNLDARTGQTTHNGRYEPC